MNMYINWNNFNEIKMIKSSIFHKIATEVQSSHNLVNDIKSISK